MAQDLNKFLAEKQEEVSMAEALKRLRKNRDFRKVIETGFFEKEAIRCVAIKAQHAMRGEEHQRALDKRILAIGELNVYLQTIDALGNLAVVSIKEADELDPDLEYEVVDADEE